MEALREEVDLVDQWHSLRICPRYRNKSEETHGNDAHLLQNVDGQYAERKDEAPHR